MNGRKPMLRLAVVCWALAGILVALGELAYRSIRCAEELGQDGNASGLALLSAVAAGGLFFASYLVSREPRKPSLH